MASKDTVAKEKTSREEKPSLHAALNNFLRKHRVVFLSVFALILASVAVAAVWTIVDERAASQSAKALDRVEASLSEWYGMEAGPSSKEKADEILAELDAIAAKFGRRYAAQKSLVLSGRVYAALEDWAAAEKKFREAVDLRKDSFLAGFALQEAAAAAEERQDSKAAIELWTRVVDSAWVSVGLPHAHFVLGTLYEETKQYAEAKARYEKLIAAYPDNDWTKLARDRIILLKSQGLLP